MKPKEWLLYKHGECDCNTCRYEGNEDVCDTCEDLGTMFEPKIMRRKFTAKDIKSFNANTEKCKLCNHHGGEDLFNTSICKNRYKPVEGECYYATDWVVRR